MFRRGEKYQCRVKVIEGDLVFFDKIISPPNTPPDVLAKLMDDAEREALKLHNKGL
jgi:hypothetical protein